MSSRTSGVTGGADRSVEPRLEPTVFEVREFLEIAEDFSNPCEIFREAISNAFDAAATEIDISLSVIKKGSSSLWCKSGFRNGKDCVIHRDDS